MTMKRTIKKRGHTNSSSTASMKSLPKELLIEVIARVASHSLIDLINIKMCCKDFLDAAEDSYVYQHVSLDKFPSTLLWHHRNDKELSFLKRCKESQNMEILFREGLGQYFDCGNIGGLEILKIAAQEGHKEAKYVYGMIMLCSQNEDLRKQGLEHVRFLRESLCVLRCRKKVEKLTACMWIDNKMLLRNPKTLCQRQSTCKGWGVKNGEWLRPEDKEDDNNDINICEYCRWDHELRFFYRLFNADHYD